MSEHAHTADAAHAAAPAHAAHDAHADTLANESVFFGIKLPVPLYTAVFGALAVLTIFEVIIAELPDGGLGTLLLVTLSIIKGVLVVWYYMHLRTDSKLYALAIIIPLLIGIVATIFLLAVPSTGYGN
jgi:caa(3)-type oxidase subunit IV